jgi:hypothetical protein
VEFIVFGGRPGVFGYWGEDQSCRGDSGGHFWYILLLYMSSKLRRYRPFFTNSENFIGFLLAHWCVPLCKRFACFTTSTLMSLDSSDPNNWPITETMITERSVKQPVKQSNSLCKCVRLARTIRPMRLSEFAMSWRPIFVDLEPSPGKNDLFSVSTFKCVVIY